MRTRRMRDSGDVKKMMKRIGGADAIGECRMLAGSIGRSLRSQRADDDDDVYDADPWLRSSPNYKSDSGQLLLPPSRKQKSRYAIQTTYSYVTWTAGKLLLISISEYLKHLTWVDWLLHSGASNRPLTTWNRKKETHLGRLIYNRLRSHKESLYYYRNQ